MTKKADLAAWKRGSVKRVVITLTPRQLEVLRRHSFDQMHERVLSFFQLANPAANDRPTMWVRVATWCRRLFLRLQRLTGGPQE